MGPTPTRTMLSSTQLGARAQHAASIRRRVGATAAGTRIMRDSTVVKNTRASRAAIGKDRRMATTRIAIIRPRIVKRTRRGGMVGAPLATLVYGPDFTADRAW